VINVLKERVKSGYKYHIIATSEGAHPKKDSLIRDFKTIRKETIEKLPKDTFGNPLLAKLNISQIIVDELNLREDLKEIFNQYDIDFECRSVVLGHTMRAGTPNCFDRILGLRFGLAAMKLVLKNEFGYMVSLQGNKIVKYPLSEGVKKKYITAENDKMELRDLLVKVRYLSKQK
jgi:ATP-dependent phosphofructokinase / diphosphate-dependent phosphofructokinase